MKDKKTNKKVDKNCPNCNEKVTEKMKFCANCGVNLLEEKKEAKTDNASTIDEFVDKASKTVEKVLDTEDNTNMYTKKDINNNKAMAVLSYIGPLALLPYFGEKNSKFARFHAVNGMNLFIWEIVLYIITDFLESVFRTIKIGGVGTSSIMELFYGSSIPWFISLPLGLINFCLISLSIIGIVYAACGKAKELPFISHIKVVKK